MKKRNADARKRSGGGDEVSQKRRKGSCGCRWSCWCCRSRRHEGEHHSGVKARAGWKISLSLDALRSGLSGNTSSEGKNSSGIREKNRMRIKRKMNQMNSRMMRKIKSTD